jgi:hypothetical protein
MLYQNTRLWSAKTPSLQNQQDTARLHGIINVDEHQCEDAEGILEFLLGTAFGM